MTAPELDGATVRAIVAAIQAASADERAAMPADETWRLADADTAPEWTAGYVAGLERAADIAAILGRGGRPAIEPEQDR